MAAKPVSFEEFCKFYGIHHYGDKKTYERINSVCKLVYKKMQEEHLLFPNFEMLIDYLHQEHEAAPVKYKFIYWYAIEQFYAYQTNAMLYAENYKEYNIRMIGFSRHHKCHTMRELKQCLDETLKRLKTNPNDEVKEKRRQFIIMARYICDYLEEYPDEIPKDLFIVN